MDVSRTMLKLSYRFPVNVMHGRRGGRAHLVYLECHGVGLEGFFVVVFALLYECPDVPTYVGLEVLAHAILDEVYACFTLAEVDQDEALHAHRFCGNQTKARTRGLWMHEPPCCGCFLRIWSAILRPFESCFCSYVCKSSEKSLRSFCASTWEADMAS